VNVAVAVLFGGPSPEHDISILTGLLALRELAQRDSSVQGIYWSKTGSMMLVAPTTEASAFVGGLSQGTAIRLRTGDEGGFYTLAGRLGKDRRLDISTVLLATHGGPGEDGTIQAALDLAGLDYSGPTVAGAALGMDKWAFGSVVAQAGLPTLARVLLTNETTTLPFGGPIILKPRFGGSSIGIDVVADLVTAKARLSTNPHLALGCVAEPFRADLTDLQIAVRTYPQVQLSAIERPLRRSVGAEILNYQDKYVGGEGMVSAPRELPATLHESQRVRIETAARTLVDVVGIRGVARIDFLGNDEELYVNEVNTIPGSLSKYLFIEPPLPFGQLLADLVSEAQLRPAHRYSSAGADGVVLRGASEIAAKLA
jgi:D-alanine-D-alanine ligase